MNLLNSKKKSGIKPKIPKEKVLDKIQDKIQKYQQI